MSVTEENDGEIHLEASFDNANPHRVSVQHGNNQEEFSEGIDESKVQLSVQCVENQRGLHGKIVYGIDDYTINLQPQAEPDIEDE